ncbi:MAG: DUF3108 domain-containing protein [Alphaproteobacteria bacterium]|nr:DUF3108 domain-containing protein [Alphaproteobacteria bacterium]
MEFIEMILVRTLFPGPARLRIPLSRLFLSLSCCGLSLGFGLAGSAPAAAQGRLDAQYSVTLVGIPVAKGNLHVEIHGDQFVVKADGGTAKLLRLFTNGSGSGTSEGRVVNGALVSSDYRSSLTTSKKTEEVHIALTNGNVREVTITPTPSPDPNRTPLSDAHRHDVHDPMTGAAVRVPGTGDVLTPEACHTTSAVFDGRMRFDLKFEFRRMEQVRAAKGYRGPVVVCSVYFVPVAGYIPDRPTIKYLSAQRSIEIALAPIAGTRILAPFWMRGPTPLGTAMLEATSFVTQGEPTPAPAPTVKPK